MCGILPATDVDNLCVLYLFPEFIALNNENNMTPFLDFLVIVVLDNI